MIKKTLLISFMLFAVSRLSAAFQYEVIELPKGKGGYPAVSGKAYYIRVTEGSGSLYIMDKINTLYSSNNELLNTMVNVADTSQYGWVDRSTGAVHQADGAQVVVYSKAMNQYNPVVTQTAYKLGDFTAGDEVGVWVNPLQGGGTGASILDYTSPINSSNLVYREYGKKSDQLGNQLAHLSFTSDGSVFFGFYGAEGGDFSGQPLPGMLASFLLGGAALGAVSRRKKRRCS